MQKINKTSSLKEILNDHTFGIDYYQREYRWGEKQIEQMLDDFHAAFFTVYDSKHETTKEVAKYGYYYMDCIVCTQGTEKQIINGRQRLTSLTLLLIYMSRLQKERGLTDQDTSRMIYSNNFGERCYDLNVPERSKCFEALQDGKPYKPDDENSANMLVRYADIEEKFSDDLKGEVLPFFIYWLINKALLLEIETHSEDEAHTIFLTMNDRGLSLNSAEMMKAFILQQGREEDRKESNEQWQACMRKIKNAAAESSEKADVEFLSTWLRSKFAQTLRIGGKESVDQDYELPGEKFHTWVRQNAKTKMGLEKQAHFFWFVMEDLPKATSLYIRINEYSKTLIQGFEPVFYNANRFLTYQTMLIMSAVNTEDEQDEVDCKINAVSSFIDILATVRILNFKKVNWNTNKSLLFRSILIVRGKTSKEIGTALIKVLNKTSERVSGASKFGFLSAFPSGSNISLNAVDAGDLIFCHVEGKGFLGIGLCTLEAVLIKDFKIDDGSLLVEAEWYDVDQKEALNLGTDQAVGIKCLKTVEFPEDGYWEKGLKALQIPIYTLSVSGLLTALAVEEINQSKDVCSAALIDVEVK